MAQRSYRAALHDLCADTAANAAEARGKADAANLQFARKRREHELVSERRAAQQRALRRAQDHAPVSANPKAANPKLARLLNSQVHERIVP